ncbi:Exo-beta-D-glucosaminidase [Polaribacter huanghezhanensis]|uniref:beta-mannosidase n=1 Tax=Polaribacter huanghezhanensis TaxID=1354726 RepID=UPI002648841C|nr:glycoside hydrolase family 2 protein [Polaribacter huanghezhanensis]WKD87026.1 Exo-beta-D-glucosaminidase [Polaribacter huanghezhanensis]
MTSELPTSFTIHKNWEFKSVEDTDWKSASVPGNIFTDLLDHKLIPDPFIETNEEKVQWVAQKNWEYKTAFTVNEETLQKENINISFEGLDTYAKVYLNNQLITTTSNAFRTYTIDVKKHLKSNNILRIVFTNTAAIETVKEKNNPYQLPEGKRIYTRKAQFQYGWDWGPKMNTSGIWKNVSIKAWNDIKFDDIFIKQKSITANNARLEIEVTIDSDEDKNIMVVTTADKQIYSNHLKIAKGKHTYSVPFDIKNPKLWWTHNLGKPHLYQFDFKLIENNTIKDEKSIKKGIRTIKLITEKDSIGESFYFELNGKPVYMKGANYIPQNSFKNKVTDKKYDKLLSDVVASNMNMLRVWGGGIYENDVFYDLCDEKGILIWQDFMFACAMYPGDKEFLSNVKQEAEDQVKRLRNHASIALWAGNNENAEGWNRWGWQDGRTEKEKKEIWSDYLAVFDSILPKTVAKFSETNYWESSPKFGRGNTKYEFEGDVHDWWVWHDARPFEHFQKQIPRFMSEFGFQSFPSYEAINYINQKEEVDLKTDGIKSHQKHSRGFQLIDEYMLRDYNIPTSDEDYVYISQLLQAKGIVMGIEAHRRAKPYNMGTLFWQLNDCWPAISWSSIDYFGNWKALQYKAKKSFENVLISYEENKQNILTYVINDTFEELNGELKMKMIDFKGNEIWSNSEDISVKENVSQKVATVPNGGIDRKNQVLISEFNGKKSLYFFSKPKELNLPKGEIQKEITKTKTGFSIIIKSAVLQKEVFLFTKNKGHFSDNFFDVLPNEAITIEFATEAASLDDLQIKSLNSIY